MLPPLPGVAGFGSMRSRQTTICFGVRSESELNFRSFYESSNIYVLQSMTDTVVGYYVCGVKTTEIPGAKLIVTVGRRS